MNQTQIVALQNISVDTMFHIGPYKHTIKGVLDLLADSKVKNETEDTWHMVLFVHDAFKRICNTLSSNHGA